MSEQPGAQLSLWSVPGIPRLAPGDDVGAVIADALRRADTPLRAGDALVVCSKLLSRAEGRFVDLSTVRPGPEARKLAEQVQKDAALVELILAESSAVSRTAPGVLIVRHRLGFVSANAGIDASNAQPPDAPPGSGPWVLLLPHSPDDAARALRRSLEAACGTAPGIVISDSHGRPFRRGAVGVAIGAAGLPALLDGRGARDLDGRALEHTETAVADQLAAAADLLAGQAAEGRPVTLVRGLRLPALPRTEEGGDDAGSAAELYRDPREDLYA